MWKPHTDSPEQTLRHATRLLEFMNEKTLKQLDQSIAAMVEMGAGPDVIDPLNRVRERHRKAFNHTIKLLA
jgi:hypothetical protein|tara:strand:- start:62 stop:274 length:213 start_codon:yes stop_codon:yes gene_type:complete